MKKQTVIETCKATKETIPEKNVMTVQQMEDIKNSSKNLFDFASNLFYFGYAQGVKAAKGGVA